MRWLQGWLVVCLLMAMPLAGCTGGDEPGTVADVDQEGDVARLAGVVVTEELVPIEGAQVQVGDLAPVYSDASGAFEVGNVTPGAHRVVVQAIGFQGLAQTLEFLAGQVVEHQFTLSPVPVIEPYAEVLPFRGYMTCEVNAVVITYALSNSTPGCGQRVGIHNIQMQDTWRYAVVEASWETEDALHVISDTDTTCIFGQESSNPCFRWETSESPLRFDAIPGTTWDRAPPDFTYPEGEFLWVVSAVGAGFFQQEINEYPVCSLVRPNGPPCAGVGPTIGFSFDEWVTVFHHEAPTDPASYTALPDQ